MWRVRSSSLSRRVRSCLRMTSESYSSSENAAAMPVCSCSAHPEAVEVERTVPTRRVSGRSRDQALEIFRGSGGRRLWE